MKRYLFYDNMVRSAGLGHTLMTYDSGLAQAIESNQIFLPCLMRFGHNLGQSGFMEAGLGLDDCSNVRSLIKKKFPDEIEEVP